MLFLVSYVSMMESKVYNGQLVAPSSFFVCGASGSGKSVFVKRLIENKDFLFNSKIEKVFWCYGHYQELFQDPALRDVNFVQGFNPEDFMENTVPGMVIIDDLMAELAECKELVSMFTKNRHLNITTVFLTQNLFFKSSVYRSCSLNANYFVIMRMIRDKKQIMTLVHQMFADHPKFAKEAIMDATKKPFSYVLIDTRQSTPEELRLRTHIFPDDWVDGFYAQLVYVPK